MAGGSFLALSRWRDTRDGGAGTPGPHRTEVAYPRAVRTPTPRLVATAGQVISGLPVGGRGSGRAAGAAGSAGASPSRRQPGVGYRPASNPAGPARTAVGRRLAGFPRSLMSVSS